MRQANALKRKPLLGCSVDSKPSSLRTLRGVAKSAGRLSSFYQQNAITLELKT